MPDKEIWSALQKTLILLTAEGLDAARLFFNRDVQPCCEKKINQAENEVFATFFHDLDEYLNTAYLRDSGVVTKEDLLDRYHDLRLKIDRR